MLFRAEYSQVSWSPVLVLKHVFPVHDSWITHIIKVSLTRKFMILESHTHTLKVSLTRTAVNEYYWGVCDIGVHVYLRLECGTYLPFLLFLMPPCRDKWPGREVPRSCLILLFRGNLTVRDFVTNLPLVSNLFVCSVVIESTDLQTRCPPQQWITWRYRLTNRGHQYLICYTVCIVNNVGSDQSKSISMVYYGSPKHIYGFP